MKMSTKVLLTISLVVYFIGFLSGMLSGLDKIDVSIFLYDIYIDASDLTYSILLNNLLTISLTFLGGFTMAALTAIELMMNGATIGCLFVVLPKRVFAGLILILPHGILEIPAIIIAGAAGFKIPYEVVRYLTGKKEQILTREDIKEYLTLALISIILIVIAAWIEANVTLKIAKAMLNSKKY